MKHFYSTITFSCSKASGFLCTNSLGISDAENQTRACPLSVKYILSILKLPLAAYYTLSEITKFVRHGERKKSQFNFFIIQLKACVHYFLSNFYFSPNASPSKTMKNVLQKFEYLENEKSFLDEIKSIFHSF